MSLCYSSQKYLLSYQAFSLSWRMHQALSLACVRQKHLLSYNITIPGFLPFLGMHVWGRNTCCQALPFLGMHVRGNHCVTVRVIIIAKGHCICSPSCPLWHWCDVILEILFSAAVLTVARLSVVKVIVWIPSNFHIHQHIHNEHARWSPIW